MYELIVLVSRFLFVFYIIFFLWQSAAYILSVRGAFKTSPALCLSYQRVTLVFMHITAFLILSYNKGRFTFDSKALIMGGAGLLYIYAAPFIWVKTYKNSNPLMWNLVLFMMDLGVIMLYRLNPGLAIRQGLWILLGTAVSLFIPFVMGIIGDPQRLGRVYVILGCVLILLPFILGKEEYGSLNWIYIGPISFQPSEIVKFLFVFYMASRLGGELTPKKIGWTAVNACGLVIILVLQKDLGGALIFFITYFVMLYCATSKTLLFFGGMGLTAVAASVAYRLFSHVRVRVNTWRNPWSDPDRGGYQILQSLFAISTWGFLGSGLGQGTPGSIPVVERDFIFAAICEEFGGFFGICLITLIVIFFFLGISAALRSGNLFNMTLAVGFTVILGFQYFLILGGVVKLIPLTGVTMPFVSYGGTSILVSILIVGILQWIYMNREPEEGEAAEKDYEEYEGDGEYE